MSARAEPLPADVLGVLLDAAHGRMAAARRAAAGARGPELALALHSLKGLCGQAGATDLARVVHELEDACDGPAGASADLEARLGAVAAGLEALPGADRAVRVLPVEAVVDRIVSEMDGVASRRGVRLAVERAGRPGLALPARTAGLLLDVLGHLARNAVVHGGATGAVRVRIFLDRAVDGQLVAEVSDDGTGSGAPPAPPDLDAGRGRGLDAAAARVRDAGGRLTHGPATNGYRARLALPAESLKSGQSV